MATETLHSGDTDPSVSVSQSDSSEICGIQKEAVLHVANDYLLEVSRSSIHLQKIADELLSRFAVLLDDRDAREQGVFPIRTPQQLFQLCRLVDQGLKQYASGAEITNELKTAIKSVRASVSDAVINTLFEPGLNDVFDEEIVITKGRQRELSKQAAQLLALVSEHNPILITPEWIQNICEPLYRKLIAFLVQNHSEDWSPLLKLLPDQVRKICDFKQATLETERTEFVEALRAYKEMFAQWPELAADLFVITHKRFADFLEKNPSAISRVLGGSRPSDPPEERNLNLLPPEVLQIPEFRRVAINMFRDKIYSQLRPFHDLPLDHPEYRSPASLLEMVRELIAKNSRPVGVAYPSDQTVVKTIGDQTMAAFEEILNLRTPARLNDVIVSKDGKGTQYGMSLRQRIAIYEALNIRDITKDFDPELRGKLIAFYMGMGKTWTGLAIYEALREAGKLHKEGVEKQKPTKMLYICPHGALPQQIANQVKEHYRDGVVPKVGIIVGEIPAEDLKSILKTCEIVIVTYSMLNRKRTDKDGIEKCIYEHLIDHGFDFIIQDEAQNANKYHQPHTRAVREIVTRTNPHMFVQLSGNPYPNDPADAIPQLALARPDLYGARDVVTDGGVEKVERNISSLRDLTKRHSPRILRAASKESVLVLDPPESFENSLIERSVRISDRERHIYQMEIARDIPKGNIYQNAILALLNPALVSPGCPDHSLADACGDVMYEYLEGDPARGLEKKNSIVIFECLRNNGVLQKHSNHQSVLSFFEIAQQQFKKRYGDAYIDDVDFYIIEGGTSKALREYYLLRVQYPHLDPTIKTFLENSEFFVTSRELESSTRETEERHGDIQSEMSNLMTKKKLTSPSDIAFENSLSMLAKQSYVVAHKLIGRLKSRENGVEVIITEYPELKDFIDSLVELQDEDSSEDEENLDEAKIAETLFNIFLECPIQAHLKQWLTIKPANIIDRELCSIGMAKAYYDLKLIKLTKKRDDYLKKVKKKGHDVMLQKVIQSADGNFARFLNLLELPQYQSLRERFKMDEEQCPDKKTRVVLNSWLTIIHEGIDLSLVDRGIFVDPGLRYPDMLQGVKRLIRHGRGAHISRLHIEDSIFEGIWEHSQNKFSLVKKLLYGEKFSDEELKYIDQGDFGDEAMNDVFLLSPIVRALMTDRQKLARYFSWLDARGVKFFLETFVQRYGQEYVDYYMKDWENSYSANNGRFVAALIDKIVEDPVLKQQGVPSKIRKALDAGCGPFVLENTFGLSYPSSELKVLNIDLNPAMLVAGEMLLRKRRNDPTYKSHVAQVASITDLRGVVEDASCDLVNNSLSINYLSQDYRVKNIENHERAQFLREAHRALKPNGLFIITLPSMCCSPEEHQALREALPYFGFRVIDQYSGEGVSTDVQEGQQDFTNWVISAVKTDVKPLDPPPVDLLSKLKMTRQRIACKASEEKGLRPKKTERPADPQEKSMDHHVFMINGEEFEYSMSLADAEELSRSREYRLKLERGREMIREMIDRCGLYHSQWDPKVKEALQRENIIIHLNQDFSNVDGKKKSRKNEREKPLKKQDIRVSVLIPGTFAKFPVPVYDEDVPEQQPSNDVR